MPPKSLTEPAEGVPATEATDVPTIKPYVQFSQAIADIICEQLAEGKSLRRIIREGGDTMPSTVSVYRWLKENPDFRNQYAGAREDQADTLFEETLDIADDSTNDWEERKHFAGDDESPQVNGEAIARARLRIDTRKWMAGKLRPKKYGDKLDIDQKVSADGPLAEVLGRIASTGQRLIKDDSDDQS